MKVCPISVSHVRNYQNFNVKHQSAQTPNFKGWGGALGTILGAGAGVLLTAATGGTLAWTIPALSGGAAIGGDIYEKSNKPSADDFEFDSFGI